VQKLNDAIREAMQAAEVQAVLAKLGADAAPGTPGQFARLIDMEIERWGNVAKAAGIRVE